MKYSNLTKNLNFTNTFLISSLLQLNTSNVFSFFVIFKFNNLITFSFWSKNLLKKVNILSNKKLIYPPKFLIKSTVSCFNKKTKHKLNLFYTNNNLVRFNKVSLSVLPSYLKILNLFFSQTANSNFTTYWLFKNFYNSLFVIKDTYTLSSRFIKIKTFLYKNFFKNNIKNL